MKKNVGILDKRIRMVVGVLIVVLGIYFERWWGLVGLIPIVTALTNRCPLYLPFGVNTNKQAKK